MDFKALNRNGCVLTYPPVDANSGQTSSCPLCQGKLNAVGTSRADR
jgi:hypothetical protein